MFASYTYSASFLLYALWLDFTIKTLLYRLYFPQLTVAPRLFSLQSLAPSRTRTHPSSLPESHLFLPPRSLPHDARDSLRSRSSVFPLGRLTRLAISSLRHFRAAVIAARRHHSLRPHRPQSTVRMHVAASPSPHLAVVTAPQRRQHTPATPLASVRATACVDEHHPLAHAAAGCARSSSVLATACI